MNHPDMELRFLNDIIGYGVFATKFIPRGTILWMRCDLDQELNIEDVAKMQPHCRQLVEKYSYIDAQGHFILSWDLGKYFNHSCNPSNVDLGGLDISIARRDIFPGDEITCEYGSLNLIEDMVCYCGAASCRQVIHYNDVLTYSSEWSERTRSVLPFINQVAQPIYPFIRDKQQFNAIVNGEIAPPPHQDLYCPPEIMQHIKSLLALDLKKEEALENA